MEISVRNLQKKIPLNLRQISRIVKKILRHEDVASARLSIVFLTDHKIKSLNKKYLKRDHATDVLAFDLRGSGQIKGKASKRREVDGEVVISTTTAARNARVYENDPYAEVVLCVIHGILHLLGYDDHVQKDIKKMRAKEQEILEVIGL